MKSLSLVLSLLLVSVTSFTAFGADELNHFQFTYRVEVPKPTENFRKLQVWIPMPAESAFQKILATKIVTPLNYKVNVEKKLGNKMLYIEVADGTALPASIEATYEVSRQATTPLSANEMVSPEFWNPDDFLERDQRVPINGQIATLAAEQTAGLATEAEKIRSIYKYVTESMTYNKDGTGWGQGDAVWACNSKRGNCTDFHSLLIGMARSQKIPAKFEIGFPIPSAHEGVIPGYHCWAWVYSSKVNRWIPLDSSEAKNNGKLFEYLGYLPNDRLQFSGGRDLVLSPAQHGDPLNYFIYPYVEIDGKVSASVKRLLSYKRL